MKYRIGEFSSMTGLSIRTLRYYDEIDLLTPAEIDLFTGYRYYSEEQLKDVKTIEVLKEVGFSLEEIKNTWNQLNNRIMLQKKKELLDSIEQTEVKLKKIDYLRSHIEDGKLYEVLPSKERVRKKKLY